MYNECMLKDSTWGNTPKCSVFRQPQQLFGAMSQPFIDTCQTTTFAYKTYLQTSCCFSTKKDQNCKGKDLYKFILAISESDRHIGLIHRAYEFGALIFES